MQRCYPLLLAVLLLTGLLLLAGSKWFYQPTLVERVRSEGELVVVTQPTPSAVQHSASGPAGLEYDLVKAFADELGVKVRLILARNTIEVYQALVTGQAHLAAASLTVPDARLDRFRFTKPYLNVESQVIYRFGNAAPADLQQLAGMTGRLGVTAGSANAARIRSLAGGVKELQWEELDEPVEELLYQVWSGELDFTVADSHDLLLTQRHYPELRVAFSLNGAESLAWAFPNGEDRTLFDAAEHFLDTIRENGGLAQLQEQYYGHLGQFDYVGIRRFLRHITERLPDYRETFQAAAEANGLDWRLLAALSYQESHWDPGAISPTGVRGMMMLTLPTARQLGVNRLDPTESIHGGARYIRSLRDRMPDRIEEPVRTWLALAAYNVGMGHLQDARIITETQGRNADTWMDIKDHLPLLADPKWHSQTRHGYARGREPVIYVTQVRSYYDILVRVTDLPAMEIEDGDMPGTRTVRELEARRLQLGAASEAGF
ncbi:MAG: membrane-bound lytic murein transglycosylase MltF [Aquisalimonadaceae bacterium]